MMCLCILHKIKWSKNKLHRITSFNVFPYGCIWRECLQEFQVTAWFIDMNVPSVCRKPRLKHDADYKYTIIMFPILVGNAGYNLVHM